MPDDRPLTRPGDTQPRFLRARTGLRFRVVLALLTVALIISSVFIVASLGTLDELEMELLDRRVDNELLEFAAAYEYDPDMPLLTWGGLERYVVRGGADGRVVVDGGVPPVLQEVIPGEPETIRLDGRTVLAGAVDVDPDRLYVTIDLEPVIALERRVQLLTAAGLIVALLVATVAALALGTAVTRPITALARSVAALNPPDRLRCEELQGGSREVRAIADAFDQFLERLDAFVAREQAFTEDASHELRTPLAIILNAAELLYANPELEHGARQRLQRILRAVEQMQATIDALLFLARESDLPDDAVCDMQDVIADAVEMLAAQARARGVTIRRDDVEETLVHAPGAIARSVVQNLVSNAIAHAEGGEARIRLRDRMLTVEDSGVGIAEEELAHIFERRYRGSGSAGQGIGLHLVKRICERLGWSIEADSHVGQGARFRIRFGITAR